MEGPDHLSALQNRHLGAIFGQKLLQGDVEVHVGREARGGAEHVLRDDPAGERVVEDGLAELVDVDDAGEPPLLVDDGEDLLGRAGERGADLGQRRLGREADRAVFGLQDLPDRRLAQDVALELVPVRRCAGDANLLTGWLA